MDTTEKYNTFMAYNSAIKMLSEIADYEIKTLPEDLREFFKSELSKQANRYATGEAQ